MSDQEEPKPDPGPIPESPAPFWDASEAPLFLSRTQVQYARVPFAQALKDRGLENARLDQLAKALPKGAFVSGGFMNAVMLGQSEKASDIDLFFSTPEAFMETYDLLTSPGDEEGRSHLKGYSTKVDRETLLKTSKELRFVKFTKEDAPPIQLVKLVWYDSAEHVIDSFDLTVVQFASDGDELVFNPLGMLDLARKRIVLHRMQFPTSTLRRLVKYAKKGFYACPGSLMRIGQEVSESLINNPGAEQYAYID